MQFRGLFVQHQLDSIYFLYLLPLIVLFLSVDFAIAFSFPSSSDFSSNFCSTINLLATVLLFNFRIAMVLLHFNPLLK
jgi:hypothetical protein